MANWWDAAPVVRAFDLTAALADTDKALGLPEGMSAAQIKVESGFDPKAQSPAGALGLAQVMPATLKTVSERLGRKLDPFNPADAVDIHREVMRENLGRFKSPDKALMAYNGGWDESRWGNPETAAYVGKVSTAMKGERPLLERAVSAVIPSAEAAQGGNWWESAPVVSGPTGRQKLLASAPMRLAKGMKDPIDGTAQVLQRVVGDKVAGAINQAADFVGGEGTFLGDVLGIKGATKQQLTDDIRSSDVEYEQARKATGQDGFDAMRFTGNVVSPVNAAVGRVLPVAKIGEAKKVLIAKGAAGGAAGAATQPIMGDDFWAEKAIQTGMGAATGSVLTPVLTKAADSVARLVRDRMHTGTINKTPDAIAYEIKASLARDDIDVGQIPKSVMDKLTAEVQYAMKSGQELDAPSLLRKLDFDRVGVEPTLGQLTRDPTQFANELNLRGVQGVGKPITDRLNEQAGVIASKFRQGTAGVKNPYEAGQSLIESLQGKNKELEGGVRAAYKAFKDSTGKDLEVPLQGLAQDYATTLRDFGDAIPSAVRGQFESLGLLTGKQLKLLSIDDAERLIKTINKNYDPANKPQARALDELRGAVQNSILNVTDSGAGMEAATLANFARDTAKKRFDAIDKTPALKAAINAAEPDDFVKKYVINGKVRELNALAKLVGPEGQKTMQQQMLKYLEGKAFGTNAAKDGSGSQAGLNRALDSIGRNKLAALLGPDQADDLFAVGRVMAYIQQQPAGSAVNNSNTGAMVASLLGRIGGSIKGAPYINDLLIKPIGAFKDRGAVKNALAGQLPKKAAELDAESINALARFIGPLPQAAGTALGYSVR